MINALFATLTAFAIALFTGPVTISYLERLRFGQQIRSDGPKTHQKKAGTPTMGGIFIIFSLVVAVLLFSARSDHVILALFGTVGFAIVGFLDDFLKIHYKRSLGLKAREKLVAQFGLALLISLYGAFRVGTDLLVPFSSVVLNLPLFIYIPFTTLVFVGATNAVNLTDGLDGLASGATAISAVTFAIIAWFLNLSDLTIFASALAGACLGFAWFNAYPAQVIMGDTGSLGLGAALAGLAVLTKTSLFLVIIGGLFVLETISVILQVGYFKLTKGKRLFKMAPLHHHYELKGLSESTVMIRFWLVSIVFAILGLLAFK